MRINLVSYASGKADILGTFVLNGGNITVEGKRQEVLTEMLDEPMYSEHGELLYSDKEPKDWIMALPDNRNGTYLRAEVADESRNAGGKGSGNFGHSGREGEVGGSGEGGEGTDKTHRKADVQAIVESHGRGGIAIK
jgi:hypothetical protein